MDGGAWRRLQCAGMMHIIRVVHAVLVSAMVCGFGASERPYSALAAYGLLRWLGGCRAAGRVRDYRSGLAWFKAWSLHTQHNSHGTMPQSFWRGRAEERRGLEDGAIRLTAHSRLKKMDMLSCIPYVCMRSRDVLNSSIYLILSSSMDLGASGRLSRAFKQCRNFLQDPLEAGSLLEVRPTPSTSHYHHPPGFQRAHHLAAFAV